MRRSSNRDGLRLAPVALSFLLMACGADSGADAGDPLDGSAADAGEPEDAGEPMDSGDDPLDGDPNPDDGSLPIDGALDAGAGSDAGPLTDAGPIPCEIAECAGTLFACGDCIDNDGDGLADSVDPDCVGACDNNEAGFRLQIPGSETPNCSLDCYFDDDQGSGNDGCTWSSFCDPLNRDGRTSSPDCIPHRPDLLGSNTCPDTQSTECHENCDALTPNGCDCFGCCELPARSGNFVFLGGTPVNGAPACSSATLGNPDSCHACTPTPDCANTCERCEVCLGSTIDDLPCDCFSAGSRPARCEAPQPDAGTPRDAGVPVDAGPRTDAGPFIDPRCPDGRPACGLPSDPACPVGNYCQTGCCTLFN